MIYKQEFPPFLLIYHSCSSPRLGGCKENMTELRGKLVMAQSGGPTAVINSSICGVIQEAVKHQEFDGIYGAVNGVIGILHENIIDLAKESPDVVKRLKHTPSSALGSCRRKLDSNDLERVLSVFKAHNIRYFLYNGGNDSMDTAYKISKMAQDAGYEMRVIGIPKTVDNDLVETDHCPGFGSVARWMAIAMRDAGRDTEAIANSSNAVKIIEAMGRDSGWITGATILAKQSPDDAPHLIYLPEVAFEMESFLHDVQRVYDRLGYAVIAVSEGIRDKAGKLIAKSSMVDAFGHEQLGGVGDYLAHIIAEKLKIKARADKPGTLQRVSMLGASQSDVHEAYLVGQMAVKYALEGKSDYMVSLVRESDEPYACATGLSPLEKVANAKKVIPAEYITPDGKSVNEKFVRYVAPLAGELLPDYMRFTHYPVQRLLESYQK